MAAFTCEFRFRTLVQLWEVWSYFQSASAVLLAYLFILEHFVTLTNSSGKNPLRVFSLEHIFRNLREVKDATGNKNNIENEPFAADSDKCSGPVLQAVAPGGILSYLCLSFIEG